MNQRSAGPALLERVITITPSTVEGSSHVGMEQGRTP